MATTTGSPMGRRAASAVLTRILEADLLTDRMSRRALLRAGGAGAAALTLGSALPAATALATSKGLGGYPFAVGIASGEPARDGVVLWTRLALDALGQQPLPTRPVPVRWEIAHDEALHRRVAGGWALARPDDGHSVHVEVDGLQPDREYWYRFYAGGEASAVGRTRTAPAFGRSPGQLRFCFVSCSQFEHGYFTAYARIVEDDPAFLVHVGDYIYEYGTDVYKAPGGNVRHHVGGEINTLADYRQRYGQYHTDADLLEARRLIPFITTPDDHEVENNYAALISKIDTEPDQDRAVFAQRRAAAYQAYWEYMPMRRAQRARNGSIQLFRELPFGDLADVVVADTRQFRTDQPCDDKFNSVCAGMDDPAQTLPGLPQERWLVDRFARSRSRWTILAQQVQMAHRPGHRAAREPVDQVQRQPPRLRALHHHQEAVPGRVPDAALRQHAGRAGADQGRLRPAGRAARVAARLVRVARPALEGDGVSLGESHRGVRGDEERRRRAVGRPRSAAVVVAVVDPGQGALGGTRVDRRELPVAAAVRRREGQEGQRACEVERAEEVLVGLLLPAAAPDDLVSGAEALQVLGRGGRNQVDDAVDVDPNPLWTTVGSEPEQRQDAVDIHEEQGFRALTHR
jgi:alkaline phosphatase D